MLNCESDANADVKCEQALILVYEERDCVESGPTADTDFKTD